MAGKKVNVLNMKSSRENGGVAGFAAIFSEFVDVGRADGGAGERYDVAFTGGIDSDGRFTIFRKSGGARSVSGRRLNYDTRLEGRIYCEPDGEGGYDASVEYRTSVSAVFGVSLVIMALLCAGFIAIAAVRYFGSGSTGAILPASFFTLAFVIMLAIRLINPDCRALEKKLFEIAGEFADSGKRENSPAGTGDGSVGAGKEPGDAGEGSVGTGEEPGDAREGSVGAGEEPAGPGEDTGADGEEAPVQGQENDTAGTGETQKEIESEKNGGE